MRLRIGLAAVSFLAVCLMPGIAHATSGDVFAKGVRYNALTYSDHPIRSGFGESIDLNVGSGYDDLNHPLYAPEAGTVTIVSRTGQSNWGNAIIWSASASSEKLFMAHLASFGAVGAVSGGDLIGRIGGTGTTVTRWVPHLHIERQYAGVGAALVLSGVAIKPAIYPSVTYWTSAGPIAGTDNPPTCGWWGPWAGYPVLNCEDTSLWLKANDDKGVASVKYQALHGGVWYDLGNASHIDADNWRMTWWPPVNTSQKVTLRATVTDTSGKQVTSDYPRYFTDEQYSVTGYFDGDLRDDIVRLVNDGSNTMSIWMFKSDGERFRIARTNQFTQWSRLLTKAVAADVDGDKKAELITFIAGTKSDGAMSDSCAIRVFDYTSGTFSQSAVWSVPSGWDWARVKLTTGDVDGNGKDEILGMYDYDGWNGWDIGLWVWRASGSSLSATHEWTQTHNGWYDWNSSNFFGGDFDGDGKDEIGSYYNYGNPVGLFIFKRGADGTWAHTRPWYAETGWDFRRTKPTVGDFDKDGRDEIVNFYNYAGWGGFSVGTWTMGLEPDGKVSNTRTWTAPTSAWDWVRVRPLAGDPDGDGRDELMALYDYHWNAATNESWGMFVWRPDLSWTMTKPWHKNGTNWSSTTVPSISSAFDVAPASVTARASSSVVPYAGTASIHGTIKDSAGKPLCGKTVRLESSLDGVNWRYVRAIRSSTGNYSVPVNPSRATYYRLRFIGAGAHPAITSGKTRVAPKVYLTAPSAPATAYRLKAFVSYGYLKPKHTVGTYPVRIQCYRYESGKWVLRKTLNARASNYSTFTKYGASVALPYAGKWRIRAYHPADSLAASTASGWRYVTVK